MAKSGNERLRRKNLALLGVLLGLAVILFCITIIKVGSNPALGG